MQMFWDCFGVAFESRWDCFGMVVGWFWDHSEWFRGGLGIFVGLGIILQLFLEVCGKC